MVLFRCFQRIIDLELLCSFVVKHKLSLKVINFLLNKDPNFIAEKFFGVVDEDEFLNFICLIEKNIKYIEILVSVVDVIDEKCITDTIFNKLFNFSDLYARERLLISLSHKRLSKNNMIKLCDTEVTFECFFEVAILYYTSDEYSTDEFEKFLIEFNGKKFGYMCDELISELVFEIPSCNEKENLLMKFKSQ